MIVMSWRRRRRRGRGQRGSQLSTSTCRIRSRVSRPALSDGTPAEPPLCLPLNILHSVLMRRLWGCYAKHGELFILKRLRQDAASLNCPLLCSLLPIPPDERGTRAGPRLVSAE